MTTDAAKLIVGLAAAVGTALIVFARKHGASIELEPMPSPPIEPLPIQRAKRELAQWADMKETDSRAALLLAKYWSAVGLKPQLPSVPWSAAFISYLAGSALYGSANHIGYARSALRSRMQGEPGVYWAFAPNEPGVLPLQRGDIVVKGRGSEPVTWSDVTADTGHKDSHGDLVLGTSGGQVDLIGGNLSDGVAITHLPVGSLPSSTFAVLRAAGAARGEAVA